MEDKKLNIFNQNFILTSYKANEEERTIVDRTPEELEAFLNEFNDALEEALMNPNYREELKQLHRIYLEKAPLLIKVDNLYIELRQFLDEAPYKYFLNFTLPLGERYACMTALQTELYSYSKPVSDINEQLTALDQQEHAVFASLNEKSGDYFSQFREVFKDIPHSVFPYTMANVTHITEYDQNKRKLHHCIDDTVRKILSANEIAGPILEGIVKQIRDIPTDFEQEIAILNRQLSEKAQMFEDLLKEMARQKEHVPQLQAKLYELHEERNQLLQELYNVEKQVKLITCYTY